MGSLISGIFDLTQGDPTKKEENQLGALGAYDTGVGEGLTTAGAGFDEAILSGDPSRIATALAPEISTGQSHVEQQRLQDANFGTRSGGTAAATNAAEAENRANIINLEGGLQRGAADSALSHGGNLLSQASGNIQSEADLAARNQARMTSDVGGIAQGAAEIASGFMDPAVAAGGGGSIDTSSNALDWFNPTPASGVTWKGGGTDQADPYAPFGTEWNS